MGGNYVFCCSSRISFNPTSHLKDKNYLNLYLSKKLFKTLFPSLTNPQEYHATM